MMGCVMKMTLTIRTCSGLTLHFPSQMANRVQLVVSAELRVSLMSMVNIQVLIMLKINANQHSRELFSC
jgi:hypothetical protein